MALERRMKHLDEQSKIYWHDAHHEALQLEFHDYKDALEFDDEFHLSKESLRMDTLIIKKNKNVNIDKNIGRIFKSHNIVEYKSEKDNFDIWDYQKLLGYANLYSAFEKISISDITISISLTIYPRELIKILVNERGCTVQDFDNGIYYVQGADFPIQILESKNLSEDENLFLRNLRSNLSGTDMQKTLKLYKERKPLDDKNVFLDRIVKANPNAFKEAMNMFTEGVREIFMEGAEQYGWLDNRTTQDKMKIAKKLLLRGLSIEDVAEDTELPVEKVTSIANQLKEIPAV
jgi:hypothetical protein